MAEEYNVPEGELFVGEDKTFELELWVKKTGLPIDMSTWDVHFIVRLKDASSDPAIFDKHATFTGAYSGTSRALNTQRASVTLTDTELNTVTGKTYRYSWKRMDDGNETILSRGDLPIDVATAR